MATLFGRHHRLVIADLCGLYFIAGVLVAIHFLVPPSVQNQLAFQQTLSDPLTLSTSSYVHLDDPHLLSNLAAFSATSLVLYVLCLRSNQRQWFWFTTITFLLVLPVVVNLTSMAVWSAAYPDATLPPSRGFSGVAAGFVGFLAVAMLVVLRQSYDRGTVLRVGAILLLGVTMEILYIYAEPFPTTVLGLGALGILLSLEEIVRLGYPDGVPDDRHGWLHLGSDVLLVVGVMAMLAVLVYSLFPSQLVNDGSITNIVTHTAGLVFGPVVAVWGFRYWGKK